MTPCDVRIIMYFQICFYNTDTRCTMIHALQVGTVYTSLVDVVDTCGYCISSVIIHTCCYISIYLDNPMTFWKTYENPDSVHFQPTEIMKCKPRTMSTENNPNIAQRFTSTFF